MCVARVQEPARVRVRPCLDCLAHELRAEAAAAVLREDVDVGQVGHRRAVRERPREADLASVVVEADHPLRLADQALDQLARTALRPYATRPSYTGKPKTASMRSGSSSGSSPSPRLRFTA